MDQNKELEDKLKSLKEDYKITFSTEQGQRVLHDLERRCHAFVTTFVKDNSHETAFLEGQRATLILLKR